MSAEATKVKQPVQYYISARRAGESASAEAAHVIAAIRAAAKLDSGQIASLVASAISRETPQLKEEVVRLVSEANSKAGAQLRKYVARQ